MKKIVLTALSVILALGATNAQNYKPGKGDVTTDVSLFAKGIFGTESPVSLNKGMLKARYFLSDDFALRGAFGLITERSDDTSTEDLLKRESNGVFALQFGVEKHFAGTERLSPYIGAELGVSNRSMYKLNQPKNGDKSEVKGPNTFGFVGGAFLGADYYVARRVYVGIEAGLGIATSSTGAITTVMGNTTNTSQKAGSSSAFNTSVNAGFKLGFVF